MKGRKHRDTGGMNDAAKDEDDKPERYNNAPKIEGAAEERKHGGRSEKRHERKHGGRMHEEHREERKHGGEAHEKRMRMKKQVGGPAGAAPAPNAGRAPRKSGGSATSNPYSSAKSGDSPEGHKMMTEMGG